MEKFNQKKLVAMLGLVAGVALSSSVFAASHGGMMNKSYAIDGGKGMVKNVSGECWNTAGGVAGPQEACGDAMPKAMEAPAPMAAGPSDSDGDGVNDDKDRCPGTRAGAEVDIYGCEVVANLTIDLVEDEFDFDSANLKPGMEAALDDLASQIKASKGFETITIIGHTDSTGPEDYNQGLSERRAQAAADYLMSQGISDIEVKGMGESQPVADNGTREGRAMNRRVEITTH